VVRLRVGKRAVRLVLSTLVVACKSSESPPVEGAFENVPEIAAADRRDASSSPIVWDDRRRRVLVATGDSGAIVRWDPSRPSEPAAREVTTIGGDVRSIALSPDGARIAVVDRDGDRMVLLDADSLATVWSAPTGRHPRAVVFDPARPRFFYVAVEDPAVVLIFDRVTRADPVTIEVKRLPSGLAVSRLRDELVVTHRVDATLEIVDRTTHAVTSAITLADSPHVDDPKVPRGKPYAFEGASWTPDGNALWVPHQTYAGDVPLAGSFDGVVFPAVSVVDAVGRREVSNEGAGKKRFPGRKELFGAIDVKTGTGDAQVVSGPCASAIHPNGQRAYVLACASDDLLVFDVASGSATEILKVPGDHAVGLTLDREGARAYVLSDQSKTVSIVDLAGGSPIAHPSIVSSGVSLLDRDPIDPNLRRALTLFHRADSDKTFDDGATKLALSGNHWMACASCHLDGFATTNAFLFEASPRIGATAAKDALIGHRNLHDFFATASDPDAATFDPHDTIVAMLEMGGLSPDRTGKDRTGAVDPEKPSAAVTSIARDLARVVKRDMPHAPSWMVAAKNPEGVTPAYSTEAEAAWCGTCHAEQYQTWQRSAHAHAAEDPFVVFSASVEAKRNGDASLRHCFGCHDPNGQRLAKPSLSSGRGVTCTSCHDTNRIMRAGGNADFASAPRDWNQPHKGAGGLALLRTAQFCGGCHQSFVPATGLVSIGTLDEWSTGPGKACVACHMPALPSGAHDHGVVGGNLALAARFPAVAGWRERIEANLQSAVTLSIERAGDTVSVTIQAIGIGHSLPTGVADLRELWIELEARDAKGTSLAKLGAPSSSTGLIDDAGPRLGLDLASDDGTLLRMHELGIATRIPFDRRVPVGKSVTLAISAKDFLATPGVASIEATLHYRNVRPPFYRAALADATVLPPEIVIARKTASL